MMSSSSCGPSNVPDLTIFDVAPTVCIELASKEKITFAPDRFFYTRDEFPNDKYDVAAKKIAKQFFAWRHGAGMQTNEEITLHVAAYKNNPSRSIIFSKTGVHHNYTEVDTWHHWFMECLSEEIKKGWCN